MSPLKQLQVANCCYAFVSNMFADLQDPAMRGVNFTWERFPSMVARIARAQVFTCVSMTKKTKTEIEDKAAEYAKEIAETLIKRAGYV